MVVTVWPSSQAIPTAKRLISVSAESLVLLGATESFFLIALHHFSTDFNPTGGEWFMLVLIFSGKRFNFPGSVSNTKRLIVTPGRSFVVLFFLLILFCCTGQVNAQVSVFGPEKYGSRDAPSTPSTKTFKVVDPSGSFDLILEAEVATNQRPESIKAIVKLNGIEVVGANDSDQTRIVKRVKLKTENVISVEAASVLVLTISPGPIITLNTNPNEPLFLRQEFPDGRTFDYFGTRKKNGEVTGLTSASLRTREGETTTYRFDKQSRITEIIHPDGLKYEFEWLSDVAAKVSLTSPDGQTRVTAPVDFSTLQGVAKTRSNCRDCLSSANDYAHYTEVRNHAVGAQEVCRTALNAVSRACFYIRIGLGLPGAKKVVCTAIAGAIAATGYGLALLPFVTGGGCELALNGVQFVCGVISAVNAIEEAAAATCSFVSKVVTTIERFVVGPKRGSILKSLTKDDGKKIPLILIHGIHGSDNLNEISYDSPYWRNFIARFKGNFALTNAFALYAFQYYSDAESVQNLGDNLGRYIDGKLQGRSHVLLAHSMGGLVAKSYMVDYSHTGSWSGKRGGDNTLLLITLATPHHGTPAANDPAVLRQYMGSKDWYDFFNKANFTYWLLHAGHLSLTSYTSRVHNRSDLRWDSYDNAISTDQNAWLGHANRGFGAYTGKTIAYGGVLKEGVPIDAAKANREALVLPFRSNNSRLEFLNRTLVYGLGKRFGGTDGMVPYQSALLCANGPTPPSVSFSCSSPTRIRRFEPGIGDVNAPAGLTLSIKRTARGYDHLDMLGHTHVLDWVVKDLLAIVPRPMVSTSLSLSAPPNGSYKTGESISGTFTIANRGGANIVMNRVVIGGRLAGTCPNNQCPDFTPGPSSVTLAPGQTVSYSGTFTPSRAGNYTFSVAYENSDGTWVMPVEPENNNKNQVFINVTSVLPNVVVSKSLTVTPGNGPFPLGQTVNGSFSITNRGSAPLAMRQILIAGRVGDTCPNDVCPDFSPIKPNVTLKPGETYNYSGGITLTRAGTYTFYVAYQAPDEKWQLPVKSENGNINRLSIVAQGPLPTLTGSSPDSLAASTTEQLLDLRGTRLRDILYCRLKAPNGTVTYIHGPLNQVIKVSDTQIRVKAKFLSRGTYIINAFTPEGRSNDFQIIVR